MEYCMLDFFPPKVLVATMFGEISGLVTERVENLAKLFKTAKLNHAINTDMKAYLITHSVSKF
ncbi:ketopantoate reductase [Paenibacillus sp. DS2015]